MAAKTNYATESGESGVVINSGVISGEEYNPKLADKNALRVYNEMVSSDASVGAALEAIKQPLLSADFSVDAASDDDKDIAIRDHVEKCLFSYCDWSKFLDEALTYLEFGHDVHEMVFEQRDGLWCLIKLGYRKQTTITRWETADHQPGVTQQVMGSDFSIPEAKLVRFTHKQRGDNYQGISILRPAYKHWYIKDKLYKIDAVGHERQALGVIEITTPTNAKAEDRKKLRKAARNLRANEQSYLEHPDGYTVEFMDMKAKSLKDVEPSINHHDRQIMKNVLAQFLEIGSSGSSGTRNVSEDQSRLFAKAVENVARYIASVVQERIIKTIVDLNYSGVEYPTMRVGSTSDENVPVLSDAIQKFVVAGALHPRPADENSVRRAINWETVEEDDLQPLFDGKEPSDDVTPLKAARLLHASLEASLYGDQSRAA